MKQRRPCGLGCGSPCICAEQGARISAPYGVVAALCDLSRKAEVSSAHARGSAPGACAPPPGYLQPKEGQGKCFTQVPHRFRNETVVWNWAVLSL